MKTLAICLSGCMLLFGAGTANAALITYTTTLSGASEAPPNDSRGSGQGSVRIDDVANTILVEFSFSGLRGLTRIAHIHCCTADPMTGTSPPATVVPSFPDFVTDVQAGSYSRSFSLLDPGFYNPAFVTSNNESVEAARDALLAGLAAGRSYLNIHTDLFPGGEIRGFLVEQAAEVPEPGSMALFALGAAGLAAWRRRGTPARR